MNLNRRNILKNLVVGTAAITGAALINPTKVIANNASKPEDCACDVPETGPFSKYFTNAVVQTHRNQKARFYDDLLKDKIVLINFMSTATESEFASTKKLIQVQNLLGERLGQDYFIYSITVDPALDTVNRLNVFTQEHGIKEGWTFLTGTSEVIEGIKARFFYQPNMHQHSDFQHGNNAHQDCSMGVMRYGNVKTGTWGSVANGSAPNWVIKRLEWVSGKQQAHSKPKRRGPYAIKGKPWLYDSGNYSI